MSEKKYSVSEIDRMRRAVDKSYPYGVPCLPSERDAQTENKLRTFMQNGTTPEELEEYINDKLVAEFDRRVKLRQGETK